MNAHTTRAEHLAWCKERALAYVDRGQCMDGLTSMMSDLEKHEETRGHKGSLIGIQMMMAGLLNEPSDARRFIEGYN